MSDRWKLIACRGCGSAIAEAALVLAGIAYDREEINYDEPGPARDRLLALNPLGQVPTFVMPDGAVMTETAAIVIHVDEMHPEAKLLPRPGDPLRRDALRWLVYFVASIYPTFTYGDDTVKWAGEAGADALRASTEERRKLGWKQMEGAAKGPWFLGAQMSALDLYICIGTCWRPRRAWFEANTPKLAAIAARVEADPRLSQLLQRELSVYPRE
jgi:GST-like protein